MKVTIEYKLQNVLLQDDQRTHDYESMYVRTRSPLLFNPDGSMTMPAYSQYRFDTYFGGCSTKKWHRYASARNFKLRLRVKGIFDVRLTYFINDMEYNIAARNTCAIDTIDTKGEIETVEFAYPDDIALSSDMVAFELTSLADGVFYEACYVCDVDEKAIRDVELNIITPTFKKEDFVRANVKLFEKLLDSNEPIADHLTVTIIDNGRTLGAAPLSENPRIKKFDNPNYGGAGGFSRGMIEALRAESKPTHLLVMDDDVSVSPESFVRTYNLLRIVNNEYKDAFLSGAMISMQLQDHQVEDVGNIFDDGTFGAVKSFERCLSDVNHVVSNEACRYNHNRQYAAFWYCCFPMSVVEQQGLCMPFFVRGDDAEFGLRKEDTAKKPQMEEFDVLPPSVGRLYDCSPLGFKDKIKMKLTHNGHIYCNDSKMTDVPGVMPNEYRLYQPSRIFMHKEIWMINDDLSTGYRTHIDRDRYAQITDRLDELDAKMKAEDKEIRKKWKEAHSYLVSEEFWTKFLGLDATENDNAPQGE